MILVLEVPAQAQSGGGYGLTWNSVDAGGYALGGTVGQPDAVTLSGSGYTLIGGFRAGGSAHKGVFLPLVLRSS